MFGGLVESRRRRDRSMVGTAFSVGAHALLIGGIVVATARATQPVRGAAVDDTVVRYQIPDPPRQARRSTSEAPTQPRRDAPRLPDPSPSVPVVAIGDAPDLPIVSDAVTFGTGEPCACDGDSSGAPGVSPGGGDDAPFFIWMVDVPAAPRGGNPTPSYPRLLRESRIEGHVLAQFVIDTTGRPELSTFRALDSSHPLFEQAVRDAVGQMRFRAAESGGKKVRVVVQQRFAFRLER